MNKEEREKQEFLESLEGLTVDELKEKCWEMKVLLKARYGGRKSKYSEEVEKGVEQDLREGLLSYSKIAEKYNTNISYVQRVKLKMR